VAYDEQLAIHHYAVCHFNIDGEVFYE